MSDTRTFGDMINRISREIKRDGQTAQIRDAIFTSIEHYKDERFFFNESTDSTAAQTAVLTFPARFLEIDDIEIEDSSSATDRLIPITLEEYLELRDNQDSQSEPNWYTIFNKELLLYPEPDRVYTFTAYGLKDFSSASPSATISVTNAWMTDAEELIRTRAKSEVFEHVLRNQPQADRMGGKERVALSRLRGRSTKYLSSGSVQKTRF